MTTQRDRLAALLHDVIYHVGPVDTGCLTAASLLVARGVRVVDVETLAAVFRSLYGPSPTLVLAPDGVTGDPWSIPAARVLAALDEEPDHD